MLTRTEASNLSKKYGVSLRTIERDYHLGLILKAIAEEPQLKEGVVFRGGTALRKCYFRDYRFSEDLDFTLLDRQLNNQDKIGNLMKKVCRRTNQDFGTTLELFKVSLAKAEYGEEAFRAVLHFQGFLGRGKVKVDLSFTDKIFLEPIFRTIRHDYPDRDKFLEPQLKVFPLEEIIADKQTAISYIRTYPRNRDLYDVWYIAKNAEVDWSKVKDTYLAKCRFREIDPELIRDIDEDHLKRFGSYWEVQLSHQVANLPDFKEVGKDFLRIVDTYFR